MPWAAVRVVSSTETSLLDLLAPFAWRQEGGVEEAVDRPSPIVATFRFEELERCASTDEATAWGDAPISLHQGHRGSISALEAGHIVVNHSCGVHYHVEGGDTPTVTCCVAGGRPGIDALQVVRGLLVAAGMRREALVPLHGAVLSVGDGHGVVLTGPKNAGKTSFALGLLSRLGRDGAALVSNDKVLLDTETLRAYGLPYAIAMHAGTLAQLPALAHLPVRRAGGKSLFWPPDVAAALGFGVRASVVLREQWCCDLEIARAETVLRPGPALGSECDSLAEFSSNLLPIWLLNLLGQGAPVLPIKAVGIPTYRVEGNPWRSWSPHPDNELW
jgi:hypothetical protein